MELSRLVEMQKKILICCDKYKGSLTSNQVNNAIYQGIINAKYPALCDLVTVSDGGDGFLSSIHGLEIISFSTIDALYHPIKIDVGYKESIVYIELAKIIGITMLGNNPGSIWERSSFGLGQLIYTILESNLDVESLVIGCGGSSTNDGGFGLLCGLGAKFYDKNRNLLDSKLSDISNAATIDFNGIHPKLREISIEIVADVKGNLTGNNGCTQLFAKQKGAMDSDIKQIETAIIHFQQLLIKYTDIDINKCGYGLCSGGIAAIFSIFPYTKYQDGADWVIKQNQLELKIAYCDMVFSGEGKIDITTTKGKLIYHIANLCKKHQKPLILLVGQIECDFDLLYSIGVTSAFSIINKHNFDQDNFPNSQQLIISKIENLFSFARIL